MWRALIGPQTSRRNKIALLAQCVLDGERVEWQWEGVPYNSRLWVSVDGIPYLRCQSFDEDVHSKLKDNRPPRVPVP